MKTHQINHRLSLEGTMTENTREEASIKIGKRTFIIAFSILLLLIITVGILTRVVPTGSYDRQIVDGKEILIQNSFHLTDVAKLPVYRWFTAPVEVLETLPVRKAKFCALP